MFETGGNIHSGDSECIGGKVVTFRCRGRKTMLGEAIRVAREKRGWSQSALARESGVSRKHISDLENGANVSIEVVKKVARALTLWSIHIGDDMMLTLEDGREVGYQEIAKQAWSLVETLTKAYSVAENLYAAVTPGRPAGATEIVAGDVTLIARAGSEPGDANLLPFEVPPEEFIEGDWDYPQTWRGGPAKVEGGIAAGDFDDFDEENETADVLNPTLRDVQSGRYGVTRVKGRSMEPKLHNGDLVLIDTFDKTPRPHRIMAVYRRGKGSAFGYRAQGRECLVARQGQCR